VAFGAKVEAGLQPAVSRRPVSYGVAIGYYEAAPSALQATHGFRNALRILGHYLNGIGLNLKTAVESGRLTEAVMAAVLGRFVKAHLLVRRTKELSADDVTASA
jgi:hypothetical protein